MDKKYFNKNIIICLLISISLILICSNPQLTEINFISNDNQIIDKLPSKMNDLYMEGSSIITYNIIVIDNNNTYTYIMNYQIINLSSIFICLIPVFIGLILNYNKQKEKE